jgi:hypothetical protein
MSDERYVYSVSSFISRKVLEDISILFRRHLSVNSVEFIAANILNELKVHLAISGIAFIWGDVFWATGREYQKIKKIAINFIEKEQEDMYIIDELMFSCPDPIREWQKDCDCDLKLNKYERKEHDEGKYYGHTNTFCKLSFAPDGESVTKIYHPITFKLFTTFGMRYVILIESRADYEQKFVRYNIEKSLKSAIIAKTYDEVRQIFRKMCTFDGIMDHLNCCPKNKLFISLFNTGKFHMLKPIDPVKRVEEVKEKSKNKKYVQKTHIKSVNYGKSEKPKTCKRMGRRENYQMTRHRKY